MKIKNENNTDITHSNIDSNNNKLKDIISKINNQNSKEIVYTIKGLKDGLICLTTREKTYIIKKNSLIKVLPGYRAIILLLDNGNVLSSKNTKVLIYNNNCENIIKEIEIGEFAREIIELKQYDNKILFLSENSTLKLIENDEHRIILDDNKKPICSIIEVSSNVIVIIFKDTSIMFFDLKNLVKISELILQNQIKNIDNIDILCINGNYLYISLRQSIFKIDIIKKEPISKYNLTLSKIYMFNNNIFGIYKNFIYRITDKDKTINSNLLYQFKKEKNIYCLYQIEEKKLMISTKEGIQIYDFK